MHRRSLLALAGLAMLAAATPVAAQDFPNRPVRLVVPFDAGSASDIIGRIFAEHFKAKLGQPVVVENKPGAGGIIGLQTLIDSPADGYTLYVGNAQTSIFNDVLMKDKMPKPFGQATTPIAQLSDTPSLFLITQKDFPVKTFKEFVEYSKANPGKVRYGMGGGVGSFAHMWAGRMDKAHGVKMTHIPVAGGTGKLLPMMLVGDIHAVPVNAATASGMVKDPNIKAVAIMANARHPEFPDVPTFAEVGYPEGTLPFWTAVWTANGVPADVVAKLRKAANDTLASAELGAAFKKLHINVAAARDDAANAKFFADERVFWTKLIDDIGLAKK